MSGMVDNYAREVLEAKVKVLKENKELMEKNNRDYESWIDQNDNKIMNLGQEIAALEKALVKHMEVK